MPDSTHLSADGYSWDEPDTISISGIEARTATTATTATHSGDEPAEVGDVTPLEQALFLLITKIHLIWDIKFQRLPGSPDTSIVTSRKLSVNDRVLWDLVAELLGTSNVLDSTTSSSFDRLAAAILPAAPTIRKSIVAPSGIETHVEIAYGKLTLSRIRDSRQSRSLNDVVLESIARVSQLRLTQAQRQNHGIAISMTGSQLRDWQRSMKADLCERRSERTAAAFVARYDPGINFVVDGKCMNRESFLITVDKREVQVIAFVTDGTLYLERVTP